MPSRLPVLRLAVLFSALGGSIAAQEQSAKPAPTHANVSYGTHERQILDFWQARSEKPAPLAIFIHGGGFQGGSKENLTTRDLQGLLEAGISVAAINYRYLQQDKLPAAHKDCVRAVQFLRSKAVDWHIDKTRIGGFGGSAGAQLVMYLAFHDDFAAPQSSDPIARESSRLLCVAPSYGQISMDMDWWDQHVPHFTEKSSERLRTRTLWNAKWYGTNDDEAAKIIADISPVSLLSRDDPPVFMIYGMAPDSVLPTEQKEADNWMTHHVVNGVELKRQCDKLGVDADLRYPGSNSRFANTVEFLKAKLLPTTPPPPSR